jgi:hypothetical protein
MLQRLLVASHLQAGSRSIAVQQVVAAPASQRQGLPVLVKRTLEVAAGCQAVARQAHLRGEGGAALWGR